MPLINCIECGNKVSNNAPFCPKCGVPIASILETKTTGAPLYTIQETSKKFKLHIISSLFCIIIGILWFMGAPTQKERLIPVILISFGLILYVVSRIRIWWHHK